MSDYIERDKATQILQKEAANHYPTPYHVGLLAAARAIEAIPAADVRPVVRGKWIPDYDYAEYDFDGSTPLSEPRKFQDGWKCSLCEGYMPFEANYCPNCGADMREES